MIKSIVEEYERSVKQLPMLEVHPIQEVEIHQTLCGKKALKYKALMSTAISSGISTQDMLKRIFERGLDKEFEYWRNVK